MKKFYFSFAVLLFGLFFTSIFPGSVDALEYKQAERVVIPKNQVIDDTVVAGGTNILVEGTVNGDFFCGGQNVRIIGQVTGDVICGAQSLFITGTVGGNVRAAAQNISLNGAVGKNVLVFSQQVEQESTGKIGGDLLVGSQNMTLLGTVGRSVAGGAQDVTLNGLINKNVQIAAENVMIGEGAKVQGNINYTSSQKAQVAQGSRVSGSITQSLPKETDRKVKTDQNNWKRWSAGSTVASILTNVLLGLLVIFIAQNRIKQSVSVMRIRAGKSMGIGLLILLLGPIAVILFMITVIGIPVGLILLMIYALAIVVSRILVAILIGTLILERFFTKKRNNGYLAVLAGVPVSWILFNIPFLGWLFCFIAILWGLGGVFYLFRPMSAVSIEEHKKHKRSK